MSETITIKNVDVKLLKEQRDFLLGHLETLDLDEFPEEVVMVDGIINLLDNILDNSSDNEER